MSRLIFLVGSYYPDFSAVGYCAYQVQKCLAGDFDITVVAFRNDSAQPLEEFHEGMRILRIETIGMKRRNAAKSASGRWAGVRLLVLRAQGAMQRLIARETVDRSLVNAYLDRLSTMAPQPSAIVPLVFPFETVLAALDYKRINPNIQVFPYLFDDFVESGSLHVSKIARGLKRGRHLRLERRMLEEAEAILSMHPLREHFEINFDKPLVDKITFLEHPLLITTQERPRPPDDCITRLCFTGSLIRKVREPDYLLDVLSSIRTSTQLRADFYVMGNDADKVRTKTVGDAIQIVNHGQVPKTEADTAVRNANILINIGEVQGKQVSSKIFEYMATGKPIIHFAYVEDDVVSKILAKYPLALCLIQDRRQFDANVRRIEKHIAKNRSKALPFEDVKANYPEALPENTGGILSSWLRHGCQIPEPNRK